jgi:hypothetical protein
MPQNLANFDAVLKDVYGPQIEEQLSLVNKLQDQIEENDSADWTGRQVTYPIHVSRNEGVGASAEGARLPVAGAQGYATVKIPEKFNYGRIELTAQVIKSSLSNKGAFARAMDSELKGMVRDLANDRERQMFGSGTGVLGLINGTQSVSATTNVNVDSPFGMGITANGARFLNPGMTIAVIAPASNTVEGTFTVAAGGISITGGVVTITGTKATTFSDNGRMVRYNPDVPDGTTNNFGNEVMGLLGLFDDGTYVNILHNVNRTTYPVFKSAVINVNGTITSDIIQRLIDATDELGGGDFARNGVFFCHHSVRREYLKLLDSPRRYTGADLRHPDASPTDLSLRKGGEITYATRPWITAKHCPYGTLFGFLKGSVTRYIHVRGEWADEDGAILRNVSNYDKWEAFYRIFDNLATDRPNDGFRADNITATVDVRHVF